MVQPRLPQAASVLSVLEIQGARKVQEPVTAADATVGKYRILRTDEMDAKDVQLTSAQKIEIQRTGKPAATKRSDDEFQGTARKAAKLQVFRRESGDVFERQGACGDPAEQGENGRPEPEDLS